MTPFIHVPFRKKLLTRRHQNSAGTLRSLLTTLCICISVVLVLLSFSFISNAAYEKDLEEGIALRQTRMAAAPQPHTLPMALRHPDLPQPEESRSLVSPPTLPANLPAFLREDGMPVPAAHIAGDASEYHPSYWPVRFSEIGYISSYYGLRTDPIDGVGTEWHMGIDLADREGSDIYAAASGTVIEVRWGEGYGETLVIDHGNGLQSRYSHCSSILVSVGDTVEQGQLIALMGSTGRSTGPHLDFRIYVDGYAVDPLDYLEEEPE